MIGVTSHNVSYNEKKQEEETDNNKQEEEENGYKNTRKFECGEK